MVEVLTHNQVHASPQEALLHYGVKGMRWGVRNVDRPAGDRDAAKQQKRDEKVANVRARAAKAEVRIKEIDDEIAATKPGIRGAYKRSDLVQQRQQVVSYRDQLNKTAEAVEAGRMTPTQKKLLITGAIVGGVLLANYGAGKIQSGEARVMMERGKARLRGKPFEFNRNDAFAHASTPDDVISKVLPGINPNYSVPGGQMNCRRCTFTYELRRRGFDVEATTSAVGYGQSETGLINALTPGRRNVNRSTSLSSMVVTGADNIRTKAFGDTRINPAGLTSVKSGADRKSLFDAINSQPAGARGEAVFNFGAFGHSLAYEKFHDGSIRIFDSQKGKSYDVGDGASYSSFVDKWGGATALKNVEITRLDDIALDTNFVARWAKNSTTSSSTRSTPRNTSTKERPANMSDELWKILQEARR